MTPSGYDYCYMIPIQRWIPWDQSCLLFIPHLFHRPRSPLFPYLFFITKHITHGDGGFISETQERVGGYGVCSVSLYDKRVPPWLCLLSSLALLHAISTRRCSVLFSIWSLLCSYIYLTLYSDRFRSEGKMDEGMSYFKSPRVFISPMIVPVSLRILACSYHGLSMVLSRCIIHWFILKKKKNTCCSSLKMSFSTPLLVFCARWPCYNMTGPRPPCHDLAAELLQPATQHNPVLPIDHSKHQWAPPETYYLPWASSCPHLLCRLVCFFFGYTHITIAISSPELPWVSPSTRS